jgi:DNA polymerase sigma
MGARVPVLKYTCALSGLDCDVSIQSSGALVKANFMALLNRHCPNLSPLYRCAGVTTLELGHVMRRLVV